MGLDRLKQIPIRDYLASHGIFPRALRGYYGMYLSVLRQERTASMKVDFGKNLWIDYGSQVGGSIIDMVMQYERCSFREAVVRLQDYRGGWSARHSIKEISTRADCEPGVTVQKVSDLHHPALIRYLSGRCIDIPTAAPYCKEVHYSIGDRSYFAVGFANDSGGYERNRYFKGSTSKDITTIRADCDVCLVFEGFIDFLSYLTLNRHQ